MCIFGSHTFVPRSWMCEKQASVPHSSTEAVMISLDAVLRVHAFPALDLWDLVKEVFHSSPNQLNNAKGQVRGNSSSNSTSNKHTHNKAKIPTQHYNFDLNSVDCVPSNAKFSRFGAMLYIFEDTDAVIKMIIKGRSPTMRHVSRTHRVALDWLFERINLDRLPGCAGQAADAVSACTQVKMEHAIRMSRYLDTSAKTQVAQIMVQYGRCSRPP